MKRVGILGLPQSGKSTVFELLLAGAGAHATGAPGREHVGVVRVPDERVDRLSRLYQPKKTTHAQIQFVDTVATTAGSARMAAKGQDLFASVRNCDALMAVVRGFDAGEPPAPQRDLKLLETEFILHDLGIVENRLAKLEKELKVGKKQGEREHALLVRLREALEAERPLRAERFEGEEEKLVRGFQFLTLKPLLVVVSQDDRNAGEPPDPGPAALALGLRAQVEREIAGLPPEERAAFRTELGIGEDGLSRVIRACYRLLGLISFFTVGPDEVRAWTVRDGDRAVDAAAEIHTDLAKGFIRAEVSSCEHLLEAGSEAKARERGWLKLEGRDYRVQDGDCLEIRFNK
jgi:GTP-binding protein YchF